MEPSASGVFCSRMLSMVNSEDVNAIIQAQRHMLDRFEKTNEMLINFNGLSDARLQQVNEHFLVHTRTLLDMKKDLDSVFRRIRCDESGLTFNKVWRRSGYARPDVHESPILEDDDDHFDPVCLPGVAATTVAATTAAAAAPSEQSAGSCDTSPDDVVSPAASCECSEDPATPTSVSPAPDPATPTSGHAPDPAALRDEGPDSVPAE